MSVKLSEITINYISIHCMCYHTMYMYMYMIQEVVIYPYFISGSIGLRTNVRRAYADFSASYIEDHSKCFIVAPTSATLS